MDVPNQYFFECFLFVSFFLTRKHNQAQRRPSVSYAANVAPSQNLAKRVVAVAAVLGLKAAEALGTQDFSTRGTRAYKPAKHGHGPEQSLTNGGNLLN